LSTAERHGERDPGAQQIAICHPLPPTTKYACDVSRLLALDGSSRSRLPVANALLPQWRRLRET
jgi:hypothetical protein